MASDEYIFNRDFRSSVRLNLNHWLFHGLAGYLLHPDISLQQDAAVVDIGTGTAIWLQELAEDLPNARLVGFDTSPEQFPPQEWRLPNVTLEAHDCFQPFPHEHLAAYDVVAIKFFRCVVRNQDPEPLLKNCLSLLKPGGYIQWFDVLGSEAHVENNNPDLETPNTAILAKMSVCPAPDLGAEWVAKLPETFAKNGLNVVVEQRIPFRKAYRLPWAQSALCGIEETSAKRGTEAIKQAQVFVEGLSKEIAQGAVMEHPVLCVVGRKPL